MVIRLGLGAAVLLAASGCAVSGETCGLGRCENDSHCVTLFGGDGGFISKAAAPGSDIDHNYWCLGTCPGGKACSGQCMEDPTDDSVVVCAGKTVTMSLNCPATLGVTVMGGCTSGTLVSCAVNGGTPCAGGHVCSTPALSSGEVIGPIAVDIGQGPLYIDLSSLAHTNDANPPLSDSLPQGITPQINVPSSCSN